jgi:serine/threonine-protein kinase HipA
MIREKIERISNGWREPLRQEGVVAALVRDYEPAFANDQMNIARQM